jgi:uncharacterized protein (DUF697 family)
MAERTQPAAVPTAGARGGAVARYLEETEFAELVRAFGTKPTFVQVTLISVISAVVFLATTSREPSHFDYFVRLADAFLHGRLYLLEAPSWLNELVPGGGGWYVVYPPVPALMLLPFVALFGLEFPQNVASCIYAGISVGLAWLLLGRFALTVPRRLMLTAVFGFGTVFWYVAEVGSAWYLGHVCAVMFSTAAVVLALDRRWPFAIGVLLGLAAISRLPVALAFVGVLPLLLGIGWPIRLPRDRAAVRATVAFGLGMAVPVGLYFLYNLARWGTLMERGYTLIPGVLDDPIYVKHGIFAIEYIPRHLYAIFLQSWRYVDDVPFLQPDWRGLGLFLTTPVFLWIIRARLQDPRVFGSVIAISLVSIPIITHGNVGLAQFGYRFSLDVQPFLFVILATVFERGMSRLAWLAAVLSIAICAYGIWAISIGFVSF